MNARSPLLSRATLACVALLGIAMMGDDCQGDIVSDPAFRDWCGSSLCSWKTDYGQIQRVPTWIAEDFGVSFLDNAGGNPPGTEISQVTQENSATCILFTSVGNIAPQANMVVKVDFDNDGTIDYTAPLGTASWTQVQTEITAPPGYDGITFYVAKEGTGTAVLAEMRIQSTSGCTAPVAPTEHPFLFGDSCATTTECATGLVCAPLGDAGADYCSQCSAEVPCPGGVACQQRSVFFPAQCAPGQGLGVTGAPCVANSDCQSGACENATAEPLLSGDAGTCDLNTIGPNDPSNCSWFTVLGGTCQ
jgi:hypothetical protein